MLSESGSEQARTLWASASRVAAARLLYVEARAATAAAARTRRLRARRAERARERLEALCDELDFVELAPGLASLAGDLAQRHRLRAGDAIHLASALWLRDQDVVVASWDSDLRRGVREAGLAVAPREL